jgi:hypothetical protein
MKREIRMTKVVKSGGATRCASKQSKAGAGCKNGEQILCRK